LATHPQFVKKYQASTKIAPERPQFANPITIVTSAEGQPDNVMPPAVSPPAMKRIATDEQKKRVSVFSSAADYYQRQQDGDVSAAQHDVDDENDEEVGEESPVTVNKVSRRIHTYDVFGEPPSPLAVRARRGSRADSLINDNIDKLLR
ncbi:unnamed protein product, partial [Vitrella brassicaformis CCMP3155]